MITFDAKTSIMIALQPIDFRAGINKLACIAQELFASDPMASGLFVFRNKRNTDIKIIFYQRNGYFLGHKRLSRGRLKWWPRTAGEALKIKADELLKLLQGVDPRGTFHPDWDAADIADQSVFEQRETDYQFDQRGDF